MTCALSVNKHQVVLGPTMFFPTAPAKAWHVPPGCFRANSVLPHRFNKGVTCALSVNKQARSLCGYGVGYVFPYTSNNGVTCILLVRGGHIVSWGGREIQNEQRQKVLGMHGEKASEKERENERRKKTERRHCWPVQKWPHPGCSFPQEPLRHRPPALLPGCPQCCHRDLASPSHQTGVGWTPAEKNHHHQNHCNSHRYSETPVFLNHPVHWQHGPEVSI